MLDGGARRPEYVLLEEGAPGVAGLRRKCANAQDAVQQRVECGVRLQVSTQRIVPPVIDQHVERLERFDVVPPQGRNEDAVPRSQFGRLRRRQSLAKLRVAREVRI